MKRKIMQNNPELSAESSSQYLQSHPMLTSDTFLDSRSNEVWLFHGTSVDIYHVLLQHGYDNRIASVKGLFGAGFYLADNICKSNEYIPCPQCSGNTVFADRTCKCQNQAMIPYDGVMVEAGTIQHFHHREIILYEKDQAYPEYIVQFQRKPNAHEKPPGKLSSFFSAIRQKFAAREY